MSAYFIVGITVTDPEDYKNYAGQTMASVEKAGGRFLAKGGAQEILEGSGPERHVIIEFPTREMAMDWYNSAEYRALMPIALRASQRDFVLVEGI